MTLAEVKNQILSHFVKTPVFTLGGDSVNINVSASLTEFKTELIRAALADLEVSGMVRRIDKPDSTAWVLTRSLTSFMQQVTIGPLTAELVADLVNDYREANGIHGDVCDKTSINETDILNVVHICHEMMSEEAAE